MNRKINAILLLTVLPAALLAGPNGLTSDILNRANSVKPDSAAVQATGARGMLGPNASHETVSFEGSRAALAYDKAPSAATRFTNEPSSLKSSLSSSSNAETQMTNQPSSLKSSLAPSSNASRQISEQLHSSE